ncbi:hypothetical protein AB4Z46_32985 [Variovorax sp. M-6]|uniref:hypothetical protein n=1 Tax=Variovorax sp. M-6 TaxID=3233041 RepID=UPI003F97BA35
MSITSNLGLFSTIVFVVFGAVFIIGYAGRQLAYRHGSDIRIVWYLFSLALTSTFLIAWWATSAGAIDAAGNFHGTAGAVLHKLLELMLDLQADLKILGAMVALVILPQFLSYVLSGLFGCAVAPMLVGPSFRFFFWSVVKSFVIAAGIILVVAVFGWVQGWNGLSARKAVELAGTTLLLLTMSFFLLYIYRDLGGAIQPSNSPGVVKIRRALQGINAWANRRTASPSGR